MGHLEECYVHEVDRRAENYCICDALRACEARVREDERSSNLDRREESYNRGFHDARWVSAKEALEGVLHENCDCEPCQAIARALAELRTIGQVA